MRRRPLFGGVLLLGAILVLGCRERGETLLVAPADEPAPPRGLSGWYYAGAVHLSWELAPGWDGETFRVYGKRVSDPDYFLVAEVTSCAAGVCTYTDVNVRPTVTYRYYVASVSARSGVEAATDHAVDVRVPRPVPPPAPDRVEAVALDGAVYLRWGGDARRAEDFSHYRVFLAAADGADFLLGETDSEGFLDERARNGETHWYYVTAVDDQGHESAGSVEASATPRPDFHEEWIYAYRDRPADAGFRFQADEGVVPLVHGDDPARHFRLEVDEEGWWLVPGPGATVHVEAFATTALKCGPASDAGCTDVSVAPADGYVSRAVALVPRATYVLRVPGDDGLERYGAVRVELLGTDEGGDALMIFDWAYQLQPGNRSLVSGGS